MFHLLQLVLKLITGLDDSQSSNRVGESALIIGVWFVIAAYVFPLLLGASRELVLWSGWIALAFGGYLTLRRRARNEPELTSTGSGTVRGSFFDR